jgi:hypothetical protein
MWFRISQAPEQKKLALSLQQKSDISTIRLVETSAHCKGPFDASRQALAFATEFRPEAIECAQGNLHVTTRFSFKIIGGEDKAEVVVLHCVMDAEYILAEGFQPSDEQIKAFREGPAILNCWPYFREYVQNTVVRMNYPPPTIPLLWIGVDRPTNPELKPVDEAKTIRGTRKPHKAK